MGSPWTAYMKTTINIEGKEFTIEQLKELINKNEDKLEKVFNFNKTTEEQFNKKWEGLKNTKNTEL